MNFWKSYICSNKLDVQETHSCFAQFNRIRNYLFGRWIEIGWFARSGIMGSHLFLFLEASLKFQIEQGDLLMMLRSIKNSQGRSM